MKKPKTITRGPWPHKATIGLEIVDDTFESSNGRTKGVSVYGYIFAELAKHPLGTKAIVCESENKAKAVSYAMTRWIRSNNLAGHRAAVQTKNGVHKVWLVPKDA